MATAPSPNDLTRQQLDELDALLQKMLSVPLAVDTPPPAASLPAMGQPPLPPSWRIDPPATAPVRSPSLAHLSLDDPPAPASPPSPKAAKPAPIPAPVPVPKPATPAAKITPPPRPAAVPPPQPKAVAAPTAVTPAPAIPPVPILALPFVALNGLFDNICGMFGPPGRLFRSGFFKQLYGFAGLGLIAYTALHIAQTQCWLTLPVTLPWPK